MEARYTYDQALDEGVVAFMMLKALKAMVADGWALRVDLLKAMRSAAIVPITKVDPLDRVSFGLSVDAESRALLKALDGCTAIEALLAVCRLAVVLVDEGIARDPRAQAVLVGLTLLEEAKEDPTWGYNEAATASRANRLLVQGRILGRFFTPAAPTITLTS